MRCLAIIALLMLAAGCSPDGHSVNLGGSLGPSANASWAGPPAAEPEGAVNVDIDAGEGVGYSLHLWRDAPVPTAENKVTGPFMQPSRNRIPPAPR